MTLDGAARARKEDAGAEARAIAAALDPAAGSDRVAVDGERAAEASGCYPTARRSRHPYRHLRHGCADAAAEAAFPPLQRRRGRRKPPYPTITAVAAHAATPITTTGNAGTPACS
jgi:hypothetical protein